MIQKTIDLYYDAICEKYPTVPRSDIIKILLYGWKQFYRTNASKCDVLLAKKDFRVYCGLLTKNSFKHFNYYKMKFIHKLRYLYNLQHIQWDGYYYFGLTQSEYEAYLNLQNKKGRKKKFFEFNNILLFKIYDECSLFRAAAVAIFRLPYPLEKGYIIKKDYLKTDKAELIKLREPLKFQDVLTTNYKLSWQK